MPAMTQAERQLVTEYLAETQAQVLQIVQNLSERQLDFKIKPSRWSISQTLDCAPQKFDPTSRCNFFKPIFMVQPAENTLRSYPPIGRQFMPMDASERRRSITRIRHSGSQARMGAFLIVVNNPLPQDRPKMLLAQRNHIIQAFTADRSQQPFTVSIGLSRQLHRQVTLRSKRSGSFIRSIHGVAADSNWLRTKAPGARTASISITKNSN
jgi:hypothetical protein